MSAQIYSPPDQTEVEGGRYLEKSWVDVAWDYSQKHLNITRD